MGTQKMNLGVFIPNDTTLGWKVFRLTSKKALIASCSNKNKANDFCKWLNDTETQPDTTYIVVRK